MKYLLIILFPLTVFSQKKDYRWKYIKNEDRLRLIKSNVTRTGVVKKIYSEEDGDLHIWLDTKDSALLNVEVICYKPVPQCNGYANTIAKPKIGDKVQVKGDYVFDNRHKWFEIHPVKTLKKVK